MTQELLGRVHRELIDVLNSINQDKIHHDGDDFHELLNDVEKALAQPEQEPLTENGMYRLGYHNGYGFGEAYGKANAPQRTWVGLTRAERFEIEKAMSKYYDYQHECKTVCLPEFAAAIEAKLKEKNT